jgi:hypothetical protein
MDLSPIFHQSPPGMRSPCAQFDNAGRARRDTLPEFLATAAEVSILVNLKGGPP